MASSYSPYKGSPIRVFLMCDLATTGSASLKAGPGCDWQRCQAAIVARFGRHRQHQLSKCGGL